MTGLGLGLAAALPFNSTKGDPLLSLGPVFAIRAKDSVEGEQWALNSGTGGQILRAKYGSVKRGEVKNGVYWQSGVASVADSAAAIQSAISLNTYSTVRLEVDMASGLTVHNNPASGVRLLKLELAAGVGNGPVLFVNSSLFPGVDWHDGTSYRAITSNVALTKDTGALAVVLEKEIGGNVSRATFYTADSIDGPWTFNYQGTQVSSGAFTSQNLAYLKPGDYASGMTNFGGTKAMRVYFDSVLDVNCNFATCPNFASNFVCTSGHTVNIASSAAVDTNDPSFLKASGKNYIYFPGGTGNYFQVGHTAVLASLTTLEYRVKVRLDSIGTSHWLGGSDSTHFGFQINASNQLNIYALNTPGFTRIGDAPSSAVPGIAAGVDVWLRGRVTISTAQCDYWYSFDTTDVVGDVSWTYISGSVGTNAGTTPALTSSSVSTFGAYSSSLAGMAGRMYVGSLLCSGSVRAHVDFTKETPTVVDGNNLSGATTAGRASSGKKTVVVNQSCWLLGADDYLEVLDNDLLDFNNIDHTVLVITRWWNTAPTFGAVVVKNQTAPFNDGWTLAQNNGSGIFPMYFEDEVGSFDLMGCDNAATQGQLFLFAGIREGTVNKNYVNNTMTSVSAPDVSDLRNSGVMRIGSTPFNAYYADMELFAVYIFRKALTAAEIAAGVQYWNAA